MYKSSIIALALLATGCAQGVNARTYPDRIVVTGELMEFTENSTERAYVLLHEVMHPVLGHTGDWLASRDEKLEHEIEADRAALAILADTGHDVCLVVDFLERVKVVHPLAASLERRSELAEAACAAAS